MSGPVLYTDVERFPKMPKCPTFYSPSALRPIFNLDYSVLKRVPVPKTRFQTALDGIIPMSPVKVPPLLSLWRYRVL